MNRREQRAILETVSDEPRGMIALQLAPHGLRTDEIMPTGNSGGVQPRHLRELKNGAEGYVLVIPSGRLESERRRCRVTWPGDSVSEERGAAAA